MESTAIKIGLTIYGLIEFYLFITGSDKGLINWILDKLGL